MSALRDALARLAGEATRGPWEYDMARVIQGSGTGIRPKGAVLDCICWMQVSNSPRWAEDAALIVALRNSAPILVAALEYAEAQVASMDTPINIRDPREKNAALDRVQEAEAKFRAALSGEGSDRRGA